MARAGKVGLHRAAGNLPPSITSFVGRQRAVASVRSALFSARLVTLTGPGGVGKSRLALQVARGVRRAFPDGVWLVELDKLSDPRLVEQSVAAALGLLDQSRRDVKTALAEFLAGKRLLLILDNCEHMREACARTAARLLAAAPGVSVLVTSRESLAITGEHLWPVPPLTVAPADRVSREGVRGDEAVALFEDRAKAIFPEFSLHGDNEGTVQQLCRRLDGLPLAIELAAVQMRVLTVQQILARLEDRFALLIMIPSRGDPRHQTLRTMVDWSFERSTAPERLLWARCSVFAGDFDLEAAEGVCADGKLPVEQVLTAIIGLIDKSILVKEEGDGTARYRMLETIRQYGREQLNLAGEMAEVRRRHCDYFLWLAEQADADSGGQLQREWAERLQAERANLWAALDYCRTVPGQARKGLRLGGALWFYWIGCGFIRDGRYWLDQMLTIDTGPCTERAKALWTNAGNMILQGDTDAAVTSLEEGRDLAQDLVDESDLTYATQFLAAAKLKKNDQESISVLDEMLARHRASSEWSAPALLIFPQRIMAASVCGDTKHAMSLLDECKSICTRRGERWALSWALFNIGIAYWTSGERRQAAAHLRESLRIKREWNDQLGFPFCVEPLSWIAAADGDWQQAAVLQGAADKLWEPIGQPSFAMLSLLDQCKLWRTRARETLGEHAHQSTVERGRTMTTQAMLAHALGTGPPQPASTTTAPVPTSQLTKREREVADLIAQGCQNKDIAAKLVISQRTAEAHVENILTKLDFSSRTQIGVWFSRLNPGE